MFIGTIIREHQSKGYGNLIKSRDYYSYRPYSDFTVFKCYRSSNPSKYWYELLLHVDGEYYPINAGAYENGGDIVQMDAHK